MMIHKDARAGFPDDRSLWKWQQQRAARQLEQNTACPQLIREALTGCATVDAMIERAETLEERQADQIKRLERLNEELRTVLKNMVDGKWCDPKDTCGISAGEISVGDLRSAWLALGYCFACGKPPGKDHDKDCSANLGS